MHLTDAFVFWSIVRAKMEVLYHTKPGCRHAVHHESLVSLVEDIVTIIWAFYKVLIPTFFCPRYIPIIYLSTPMWAGERELLHQVLCREAPHQGPVPFCILFTEKSYPLHICKVQGIPFFYTH